MERHFHDIYREEFPFWEKLTESEKNIICTSSRAVGYPKGTNIHNGSECTGVILVKKGCLRAYMLSESGKEITLYRIYADEICVMTASCALHSITFDVFVDAEEDSECYLISGPAFASVCESNPYAKIFALELTANRFSDVMWVMQQILFMSFDKRLAIFLLDEIAKTGSDTVILTHEQIAKYMGSAREVVSRMLKYFSTEGIVEASRKGIRILDKKKLRELALHS